MWDLENLNPPVQFMNPYDPTGKEYVMLRLASEEDLRSFFNKIGVKEKVLHKVNPQTRRMEIIRDFAPNDEEREAFNSEINDFTIVDWLLFDAKGEKIPCTRENKILLMKRSPKFANWISNCLEELRESIEIVKVEKEKNL